MYLKQKLILGFGGLAAIFFLILHFDLTDSRFGKSSIRQIASTVRVCQPGEGYICPWKTLTPAFSKAAKLSCVSPMWKWDRKAEQWKQGTGKECAVKNTLCAQFSFEELELQNFRAKKWDPLKFGAFYTPLYDATQIDVSVKKYDPYRKELVACGGDSMGPYFGIPRNYFDGACNYIAKKDEDFWIEKGKADFRAHELRWAACTK